MKSPFHLQLIVFQYVREFICKVSIFFQKDYPEYSPKNMKVLKLLNSGLKSGKNPQGVRSWDAAVNPIYHQCRGYWEQRMMI